jgi:hypothetical protein
MKAASQVFSLPALRSLGELASTDSFSYLLWREPARLIVGTLPTVAYYAHVRK